MGSHMMETSADTFIFFVPAMSIWDQCMEAAYGDRWPHLSKALKERPQFVLEVKNPNTAEDSSADETEGKIVVKGFAASSVDLIVRDSSSNIGSYYMDPASAFPVIALRLQDNDIVLDLCAAPGGKSLLMGATLNLYESATTRPQLICNEMSQSRLQRLQKTIRSHFPLGSFQTLNSDPIKTVAVIGKYAPYDAILLDAPCSSDRHNLEDGSIDAWKTSTPKKFQRTQVALLSVAFAALKRKGRLVYSTCSLSAAENDEVISKCIFKHTSMRPVFCDNLLNSLPRTRVEEPADDTLFLLSKTQYGYQLLPDLCHGCGPIYFCLITKGLKD
eukprot:Blabericola_migrator_1__6240@NODE_314_length_10020_cov_127_741485_g257_i0_p4_GENE_NODE_314_length_10020_cov_127_741485_g257_i0NODE_314_length_10020_cov_127_741485_g257_i0_p4_ORF_typecomplete_len330_score45_09Methyltr_RsmBF/PF01189_17/9_2e38Methyltrans_SAM/PF10672_9/0_00013FtsJ/PF01728_19/2_1e03FtsJ/PF01728_19/0_067_NODE_314_length_10020_cov_127_741485_g257_i089999988